MRAKQRIAVAVAAATLISGTTPMAPAANAAAPTQPVQGGAVYIQDSWFGGGACTIGYNDHAKGVSYTAGHCGREGSRVGLVDRAEVDLGVARPKLIGTFYPSKVYDRKFSNDWGTIVWDAGVRLGPNVYSGDTILTLDQVKKHDKVCFHGETTHQNTNATSCGKFWERVGENFTVRGTSSQQGDSGGPVWVPDRGFLGFVSMGPESPGPAGWGRIGPMIVSGQEMVWASTPRDGRRISQRQFERAAASVAGLDEKGIYDSAIMSANNASSEMGIETSSTDSDMSSGNPVGSSELTAGEIIAIIVPIVTVIIPALIGIANAVMK